MIFSLPDFENKDVIFIGKGREWESFSAFIQKHIQLNSLQNIFIQENDPDGYNEKLKNLDFTKTIIVKTAGYPGRLVPAPYTTPTKIFFDCIKQIGSKTIGITGTKGKTTTTTLLHYILQQAGMPALVAGNMGKPMLDVLASATSETIIVLELSSYQLAELEVSPDMAIITNLYRDHVDYHGNLEHYWEAKRNIMRFMTPDNTLVFNPENEVILHWLAESDVQSIAIDANEVVDMTKSQLIGEHNKLNYLLARTVARKLGVDKFTCENALRTFEPVPHRLEKVRTVRGITFVDDAIASQPEAAIAGITACVREVGPVGCVMLGGQDRDYDFTELVRLLSTLLIPKLVLFPETGAKIKAMLPENYKPETFETKDMHEAVNWAAEKVPSGSVCLLSTASPSYSVWKDFEEKGDLFQKAVLELSN